MSSLKELINSDGSIRRGYENEVSNIRNHIREVFEIAGKVKTDEADKIDPGEVQIIIAKVFGDIKNIDESKFDDVKMWFRNNWFRKFQIIDLKMHASLIQSENEYSTWFKKKESSINYTPHYSENF